MSKNTSRVGGSGYVLQNHNIKVFEKARSNLDAR